MSVAQRRKYEKDFKRNAVRLAEEPGRTIIEVAENLGIAADLLYKWRREQRSRENLASPCHGRKYLPPQEQKNRDLEKKTQGCENGEGYPKKSHGHLQ